MAVVIPYVPQTWTDGVSSCSAARNTVHEDGLRDAHFMPAVRVFHNAAQAVTNATTTTLAFNSERIDQAGNAASTMHDNAINNSRLICRYAGVYVIGFSVEWNTNPTQSNLEIRLNGATIIWSDVFVADSRVHTCSTVYPLAVNDYVEARVRQQSGGSANVNSSANYSPEFYMVRLA